MIELKKENKKAPGIDINDIPYMNDLEQERRALVR